MQGQLFTSDFLESAIKETTPWDDISESELDIFIDSLKQLYSSFSADTPLNEAQTEDEMVAPVLDLLGWQDSSLPQVNMTTKGREDVPDFLLFPSAEAKARAINEKDDRRLLHGIALIEAKRWLRLLDRREENAAGNRKPRDFGAPSSQILRYLSRADVMSDRAVKWGMLTNGAVWRLYWQDARSRSEDFFELNIAEALEVKGIQAKLDSLDARHTLKLFYLMFRREAFLPQEWDTERRSFHTIALSEARLYEESVSEKLGERVFETVFPYLANALAESDVEAQKDEGGRYSEAYLEEVREATLILLYRLLFVMYAEDRRLLPVMDSRYAAYSLSSLRDQIAIAMKSQTALSTRVANYWNTLSELFIVISEGDDHVGMPAYNGGLFARARVPLLARVRVPDAYMAPVIDALSRRVEDIFQGRINYRDLSVSHLGSIYERLLEYRLVQESGSEKLQARPSSFARKSSGSYYTHDDLVRLILEEAVGELINERVEVFNAQIDEYRRKRKFSNTEEAVLQSCEPASQILELKICDPAMGSGHFLVSLVDYLSDRVLIEADRAAQETNDLPAMAYWVEQGRPFVSDVAKRIADIRRRIRQNADAHGWKVDARQLDDRHIVRRMILKKVIFGVDKNPMAVELAKVALWLHTFTVGAPLSFLDHHLKCGDSLHGEKFDRVRDGMNALGTMFQEDELNRLQIAARSLEAVAELTDTSIAEVEESKHLACKAEEQVAPIHALLDFWRALRWLVPGWPTNRIARISDVSARLALAELFSGRYNLAGVVVKGRIDGDGEAIEAANDLLARARNLSERENFFHWQTAFPTVWRDGSGGFEAVIGNPPWDRIKLQQVEWFAERKPEIARQSRADDRKKLIKKEETRNSPLWSEYSEASEAADAGTRVARTCGDYPLLSRGDINLYSLFVERAQSLVNSRGVVGLLTPSGISADKSASAFFRSISAGGRLGALYDFENRFNPGGSYFPDVDSRFKFCALVFGAEQRVFESSQCAFYLHDLKELEDEERRLNLSAQDFRAVNPNTGAAPIFRNRRDAEITTRIYRTHPVLVDRSGATEKRAWPVRYKTMFHMTNDSELFNTRDELEKAGWKPSLLNRWQKGDAVMVPLYVGRMMNIFDHRASHVTVNAANLHNAALSMLLDDAEKQDQDRYPQPQYWVNEQDVPEEYRAPWALAFRDIARATDARTMIASIVPTTACGNKLPMLVPTGGGSAQDISLLLANLNSFAFDFVVRQKVHSTSINWFIAEQFPVIAPERFEEAIGGVNIGDYIRNEVLALTYTAHDMAPFARDMGYVDENGMVKPPFVWDEEDRAHRIARLDALFMYLYGLSEDDAEYILSTFPIIKEKDMASFGKYRTAQLVLGYMRRINNNMLKHDDLKETLTNKF